MFIQRLIAYGRIMLEDAALRLYSTSQFYKRACVRVYSIHFRGADWR
jgi:hypothetical protein